MKELKLRLKLKWNRKIIDDAVAENFGYSPSDMPHFDNAMKIENELLGIARKEYPKIFNEFLDSI
jgi:hypothetical protein